MTDPVQVRGIEEVILMFDDLGAGAERRLELAVREQGAILAGVVQDEKLNGGVLNVRSGDLRESIHAEMQNTGGWIVSVVGTDVKYARIHEYGGIIVPDKAKALHFTIGGKDIFAKRVTIPERSFLRSSLAERENEIYAALRAAVLGPA